MDPCTFFQVEDSAFFNMIALRVGIALKAKDKIIAVEVAIRERVNQLCLLLKDWHNFYVLCLSKMEQTYTALCFLNLVFHDHILVEADIFTCESALLHQHTILVVWGPIEHLGFLSVRCLTD